MFVNWSQVAPASAKTRGLTRDPADKAYHWAALDGQVTKAVARGSLRSSTFKPRLGGLSNAPRSRRPAARVCELAQFLTAAARRYSGSFSHLPRVRYWQIWNEPNLDAYLVPQYANGRPASPDWYRSMVNAAVVRSTP